MSAPLSTKALSLLGHIRDGTIETTKGTIMSKLMYGYMTRRQLEQATGLTSGSVTGRLNELVKAGLVYAFDRVCDEVTKKKVLAYARTSEVMEWERSCQS